MFTSNQDIFFTIDDLGSPGSEGGATTVFYYQRFTLGENRKDVRSFPFWLTIDEARVRFFYYNSSNGVEQPLLDLWYGGKDLSVVAKDAFDLVLPDTPQLGNIVPYEGAEGQSLLQAFIGDWQFDPSAPGSVIMKLIFLDFVTLVLDTGNDTPVFGRSLYFPEIKAALKGDPVIRGIWLKNKFILSKIIRENRKDYVNKFPKDRQDWINYITDLNYSPLFARNSTENKFSWLKVPEQELEKALAADKDADIDPGSEKEIVNFYLRRYSIFKAFGFVMSITIRFEKTVPGWIAKCAIFLILVSIFFSIAVLTQLAMFPLVLLSVIVVGFGLALIMLVQSLLGSVRFGLLLPKMQLAILTSISGFLSSYDFFRLRFDTEFSARTLIILPLLLVIIAIYLHLEVKKNTGLTIGEEFQFRDFFRIISKALSVLVVGLVFSLTVGVLGISLMAKDHMTRTGFAGDPAVRNNIYELDSIDKKSELTNLAYNNYREKLLFLKDAQSQSAVRDSIRMLYPVKRANDSELHVYDGNYLYDKLYRLSLSERKGNRIVRRGPVAYTLALAPHIRILIFPGFLLLTAILGLFGGILLTLLFANRQITEPI